MTKELFPNKLANRLSSLSIITKSGRLGHHKGTHRSRKTGASLDFSDFREYHPGDDLRHIDWNVYARTGQPFIKQFLDEQEMRVHIILDPTKSMGIDGKWEFTQKLAIGLAQIALKSGDTVSISTWNNERDIFFRKKGAMQRASVTKFISSIETPSSVDFFTDNALRTIPKAVTVLFVLTDGLEEPGKWEHLFKRLRGVCSDVRLITIHSKEEELPVFEGDIRFVDVESEDGVEVTITNHSVGQYHLEKEAHEAHLEILARKYGISLLRAQVSEGVMEILTKKMRRVRWLD